MELKECVEYLEICKRIIDRDKDGKRILAIDTAIQTLQIVLQVSEAEGMVRKKDLLIRPGKPKNSRHNKEIIGFNFALNLCAAYIAGKLEKVEEIIKESEPFKYCPPEYLSKPIDYLSTELATAIRASFGVKG